MLRSISYSSFLENCFSQFSISSNLLVFGRHDNVYIANIHDVVCVDKIFILFIINVAVSFCQPLKTQFDGVFELGTDRFDDADDNKEDSGGNNKVVCNFDLL